MNQPTSKHASDTKPRAVATARRHFIGGCGSAAALACATGPAFAAAQQTVRTFAPSVLVNQSGQPLRVDELKAKTEYIFQYPFRSTPCFLLDLAEPLTPTELAQDNGNTYRWSGGVGPGKSIVAFSAICAHKLTHPTPVVSFIGYRQQAVGFLNRNTNKIEKRAGVIQCCSEHSIYDPTAGASVVSGPAPQPLAAVELTVQDDHLVATGVYGGALFDRYFEQFGDRLMLEYKSSSYSDPVGKTTTVVAGSEFTKNQMRCG
jgi:Rieske Fe-S protein